MPEFESHLTAKPDPDADQQVPASHQGKDHVIHQLSHALKTPLAVLIASLKLLQRYLEQLPHRDWLKVLERAQRNLTRLLSLEYDMEDILRQRGKAETDDFFRQVNIEFLMHELKAPVSVIEAGARLLLEKENVTTALPSHQQRTLQRILRNSIRTRQMLAELLEVGRAQSECFLCHAFDPRTVLFEIIEQTVEANEPDLYERLSTVQTFSDKRAFLAAQGIILDIASSADAALVTLDETKFRQIVGNLIRNGFYYRRRRLLVHLAYHRDRISISIRDDGPGIAAEHHEMIFERYRQVAPCDGLARNGHGLGLAVARILARSMTGDIAVESELGQGALFQLTLPAIFKERPGADG